MAAKDIRRETGDVSPTNFVRPGVENHLIGDLITAGTKGFLAVDSAVQTENLAEELDSARASFIVGSPATKEATDLADEDAKVAIDKELFPLKGVLDSKKRAVEQGAITADRFQLEADAALQRAIAKRPGLGPELRQLHAEYTGGYLIEFLTKREAEMLQEHAKEAGNQQKQSEDRMKFQAQQLAEAGFGDEAGQAFGDPQVMDRLFMARQADISRYNHRKADAEYWDNTSKQQDSQVAMEQPERRQAWTSAFNLTLENMARSVRAAKKAVAGADEEQFAAMVTDFKFAITQAKSELENQRVTLGLKPEDVAERMAIIKQYESDVDGFLDGSIALDQRKKRSETWTYKLEAQLREDAPLTAIIATAEKIGGPTFAQKAIEDSAVMAQQTKQEWARFLTDQGGSPEAVAPFAAGQTAALLKDVFPQGTQTNTPVQPESIEALVKFGAAFAVLPNDKFKAKDYADWIRELSYFGEVLSEKVEDDKRLELANSVAMATYKNVRVGLLQIQQDVPSLRGKVAGNKDFASDEPMAAKEGVILTPVEQQAIDIANSKLSYGPALILLQQLYKTPDLRAAGVQVWNSAELVQGATNLRIVEERAQKAQEGSGGSGGGGSSGSGGEGRLAPAVGSVEDGYRFKGGDPSQASSWEKL